MSRVLQPSRVILVGQGLARSIPRPALALWNDASIRVPTLIFLILRIVTGIGILIMVHNVPVPVAEFMFKNPSGPTFGMALPSGSPLASFVEPWNRWDTTWYAKIAIRGYLPDESIAFPPLYPVLMRLFAALSGGNYVLSGLLVSNVCCLIALILLFKIVRKEYDDDKLAIRTVILVAAFPTAYYLIAGYTESLFLALTLGAWLATLNKRWWLAGILALFSALTRLQGAVLCLPLAYLAYIELRESGFKAILARVPAVIGAAVGAALYQGYLILNNLGTMEAAYYREWKLSTRLPIESISEFFRRLGNGWTVDWENQNAVMLLIMALMFIVVLRKLRPAYSLYTFATLFAILMRYHDGPQFESLIRYSLVLFPCFIAAAMLLERWWLLTPLVIGAMYWQALLLDRFTHWTWVA